MIAHTRKGVLGKGKGEGHGPQAVHKAKATAKTRKFWRMSEDSEIPVVPVNITEFEGAHVTEIEGRLPATIMEMADSYVRGTHLRLMVEVRVKSVRHDENSKGALIRQHIFAMENIAVLAAFAAEDITGEITGSAAAGQQSVEDAAELGVAFGRSSDQWGASVQREPASFEEWASAIPVRPDPDYDLPDGVNGKPGTPDVDSVGF